MQSSTPNDNNAFHSLPADCLAFLLNKGTHKVLPAGSTLTCSQTRPLYAHFIMSGIISVTVPMLDGNDPEICMLGPGDLLEASDLIGATYSSRSAVVKTAEAAVLKVRFDELRQAFSANEHFRVHLLENLQDQNRQLDQIAACSRVHQIEPRLARYLLMLDDRAGNRGLNVTQESLAQALGVRRTSISLAAGKFQERGFIRFRRGTVRVENRPALESAACECYSVMRRIYKNCRHVVGAPVPAANMRYENNYVHAA